MCLSAGTVEALRKLPPKVTETLAWGTVKPKPPVERAEALLAQLNGPGLDAWEDRQRGLVTGQMYEELVAVWRALGLARREGRLSQADEIRVLRACGLVTATAPPPAQPQKRQDEPQRQNKGKGKNRHQNNRAAAQAPPPPPPQPQPQRKSTSSLWVLPGADRQLLRFDQCVHVPAGGAGGSQRSLSDEQRASLCFASVGVLFNLAPASEPCSTPPWPLDDVSSEVQALLRPASEASEAHAHQVLQAFCAGREEAYEPPAERWRQDSPGASRAAFSWAVWLSAKAALNLPRNSDVMGALTPRNAEVVAQRLQHRYPHLALYCRRGPTFGPDAFHARWLPAFSRKGEEAAAPARPVLVDDAHSSAPGCGIPRSAMLRPQHRLQPAALLDHAVMRREDRAEETSRLAALDPFLASCLQVPRTSDGRHFTLKVATSGAGEMLLASSVRLGVVVQLLQVFKEASGRGERRGPMASPQLIKYSSLKLHFQSPHLPSAEVEKTATSAVWGSPSQRRAPQGEEGESTLAAGLGAFVMKHAKPLLVTGEPEEYAAELEELVLTLVYGRHGGGGFGGAGDRPTKVLRLLGFLEDGEKFAKFLRRDFASYLPAAGEKVALLRGQDGGDADATGVVDLTAEEGAQEPREELSCFEVLKACISNLTAAESAGRASREPPKRKREETAHEAEAGTPRKYGPGASSGSGDSAGRGAAEGVEGQHPQPHEGIAASSEAALESVARATGRGRTILPAWMTNKDGPSMAGPAIAAPAPAPEREQEREQESRKRPRADVEEGEEGDSGANYVKRLTQRVEDFLLSLVIEVVQRHRGGERRVTEQEAADMIKYIVKTLIEAD